MFFMNNSNEDRRVRRTKKLLKQGLSELMKEKDFKDISVKDITDRMDLNRGTFYLHYNDIYDLLEKIEDDVIHDFQTVIDKYKSMYNFAEIIPVSALKGKNKEELLKCIKKYLPKGPQFFPSDMITDQPERQIVSEIIREKSLKLLQDEIPHGIAVEVSSMKPRKDKEIIDIQATIYCERDSHKGIIIGKQGSMLKKIGSNARYEIERLLGSPINLQIWIKVKKDWIDSDFLLKNFRYHQKQIQIRQ